MTMTPALTTTIFAALPAVLVPATMALMAHSNATAMALHAMTGVETTVIAPPASIVRPTVVLLQATTVIVPLPAAIRPPR